MLHLVYKACNVTKGLGYMDNVHVLSLRRH